MCYGNIKTAYVSHSLFPLGESDHTMIHLTPRYKPVLKLSKPEIKSIQVWSDEAVESLQSCLEQTDWNVFINNCPDLEQLTDTVNSYIIFCKDLIIPR